MQREEKHSDTVSYMVEMPEPAPNSGCFMNSF